jgi:hypothetical protein
MLILLQYEAWAKHSLFMNHYAVMPMSKDFCGLCCKAFYGKQKNIKVLWALCN